MVKVKIKGMNGSLVEWDYLTNTSDIYDFIKNNMDDEDAYEWLNGLSGDVNVGGILYSPSDVLNRNDYIDAMTDILEYDLNTHGIAEWNTFIFEVVER